MSISHPDVDRSLCELIGLVSDYEGDATPDEKAIIDRARQAMKDHGIAAADASERMGRGYTPKKARVLISVEGGVASYACDNGVECHVADSDAGEGMDIPSDWMELADELGIEATYDEWVVKTTSDKTS